MTEAQGNFATALADFGCGSDEDSLIMGELQSAAACCMAACSLLRAVQQTPASQILSCGRGLGAS